MEVLPALVDCHDCHGRPLENGEICKICDLALLAACAEQRKQVQGQTIRTVADGLVLKGGSHGRR